MARQNITTTFSWVTAGSSSQKCEESRRYWTMQKSMSGWMKQKCLVARYFSKKSTMASSDPRFGFLTYSALGITENGTYDGNKWRKHDTWYNPVYVLGDGSVCVGGTTSIVRTVTWKWGWPGTCRSPWSRSSSTMSPGPSPPLWPHTFAGRIYVSAQEPDYDTTPH